MENSYSYSRGALDLGPKKCYPSERGKKTDVRDQNRKFCSEKLNIEKICFFFSHPDLVKCLSRREEFESQIFLILRIKIFFLVFSLKIFVKQVGGGMRNKKKAAYQQDRPCVWHFLLHIYIQCPVSLSASSLCLTGARQVVLPSVQQLLLAARVKHFPLDLVVLFK